MSEHARKASVKYITPIDAIELACRILEAAGQMKRPEGLTAAQAFFGLEVEDQDRWLRAATAAMNYWQECIAKLERVQ